MTEEWFWAIVVVLSFASCQTARCQSHLERVECLKLHAAEQCK